MRAIVPIVTLVFALFGAAQAADAKSCSTFAKIEKFDAANNTVTLTKEKGDATKYFPTTEGQPPQSKVPKKCTGRVLRQESFPVNPVGGRMKITQVRTNFYGNLLNDVDDKDWLGKKLKEIEASKDIVVVVLRPPLGQSGKDVTYEVTTIYMPITDAEIAEIARLDAQAEDEK